jgi:hypothetical protein
MGKPFIGECKLCKSVAELRRSHSQLPAGVFRKLRNASEPNPNPVHLTENAAFASSFQPRERLLCASCEGRFSKQGEKWVLERCLQPDGSFPLRDALGQGQLPSQADVVPRIADHLETDKIAYFASSIFWRASVARKLEKGTERCVHLGPQYEEDFRRYLLGEAEFPQNAALMVSVSKSGSRWSNIAWMPVGERKYGVYIWRFVIPGIVFDLFVGKDLPLPVRMLCMVRSYRHPIMVTDKVDRRLAAATLTLTDNHLKREAGA